MEKILTFVIKDNKLLLLLGSDKDPQFKESFWYVVTGGVEDDDKSLYDTVRREVMEETGLDVVKIIDLNRTYLYESLGIKCTEHVFVSYVDNGDVILNEESIDYKWCSIDEFLELVRWYYDKNELYNMLVSFVN